LQKIITAAYDRYCVSNPLHPDVFPAVRKMEAEIVAMVLKLYNGPDTGCGVVTSGGTESIIMALKTYRDWAKKVKGITEPEMCVPSLFLTPATNVLPASSPPLLMPPSTRVLRILRSRSTLFQSMGTPARSISNASSAPCEYVGLWEIYVLTTSVAIPIPFW
jgi:hypothetical protein